MKTEPVIYYVSRYERDEVHDYFNLVRGMHKAPKSLSIQKTVLTSRINSPYVVYNRDNGKFITGMKSVQFKWYFGDIKSGESKNYILIHWDGTLFLLFVFIGYYPRNRDWFNRNFIQRYKKDPGNYPGPYTINNLFRSAIN